MEEDQKAKPRLPWDQEAPEAIALNVEQYLNLGVSCKLLSNSEMLLWVDWNGERISTTITLENESGVADVYYPDYYLQVEFVDGRHSSTVLFFDCQSKAWIYPEALGADKRREPIVESNRDDINAIILWEGQCVDVYIPDEEEEDYDLVSGCRFHADDWRVINKVTLNGNLLTVYQIDMIDYWNGMETSMTQKTDEIAVEEDRVRWVGTPPGD